MFSLHKIFLFSASLLIAAVGFIFVLLFMRHYDETSFLNGSVWINDISEIEKGMKIKLSAPLYAYKVTPTRDKNLQCSFYRALITKYKTVDGKLKKKISRVDYNIDTIPLNFDNSEILIPVEGSDNELTLYTRYKHKYDRFSKDASKPQDGDTILWEYCVQKDEPITVAGIVDDFEEIEDRTYALSLARSDEEWYDVAETSPFKRAKLMIGNLFKMAIGGNIRPIITNKSISEIKTDKQKSTWLLALLALLFEGIAFKILFSITFKREF